MKGGAALTLHVGFRANEHDPKQLKRIGHAIERCVQQSTVIQNLLQCAAASVHEDLFPHEFEVTVDFDELDIYEED